MQHIESLLFLAKPFFIQMLFRMKKKKKRILLNGSKFTIPKSFDSLVCFCSYYSNQRTNDGKVSLLLLTCYKLSSASTIYFHIQFAGTVSVSFVFSTMYFVCLSRAGSLKSYYFLRAIDNSLCVSRHKTLFPSFLSCFISLKTQEQSGVYVVLTSNRITCGTM